MLTKERCMKYMKELRFAFNHVGTKLKNEDLKDAISLGIVGFERLITEHFNPQPLKFEDLKAGMYIWDNELKQSAKVERTFTQLDDDEQPFNVVVSRWMDIRDGFFRSIITFEDNRFYPIIIPNTGDKNG